MLRNYVDLIQMFYQAASSMHAASYSFLFIATPIMVS